MSENKRLKRLFSGKAPQAVLISAKEESRIAVKMRRARFFAQTTLSGRARYFNALSKNTLLRSFPRRRESNPFATGQDPRLRGGDNHGNFHFLEWAGGPWALRRTVNGLRTTAGKYFPLPVEVSSYKPFLIIPVSRAPRGFSATYYSCAANFSPS